MCHLFLCTDQQWPVYSVFTVKSLISPSPLCCAVESKTVWQQHRKWLCSCTFVLAERWLDWHHMPHYILLNVLKWELPGAGVLEMWMKEKRGEAHLLETADWGKRVPVRCQEMVGRGGTTPVREGKRVRLCSDWQKDRLHPISCCFQNVPGSQFR